MSVSMGVLVCTQWNLSLMWTPVAMGQTNGTEVVSEVSLFGRVVLEGLLFGEVSSFQYSCLEVFPLLEASRETLETLVGLSVCGCVTESSYSSWYVCS